MEVARYNTKNNKHMLRIFKCAYYFLLFLEKVSIFSSCDPGTSETCGGAPVYQQADGARRVLARYIPSANGNGYGGWDVGSSDRLADCRGFFGLSSVKRSARDYKGSASSGPDDDTVYDGWEESDGHGGWQDAPQMSIVVA